MNLIDSSVEGWQTSKINDRRWQTIPDESDSFREKMTSDIHASYIIRPCMDYL